MSGRELVLIKRIISKWRLSEKDEWARQIRPEGPGRAWWYIFHNPGTLEG